MRQITSFLALILVTVSTQASVIATLSPQSGDTVLLTITGSIDTDALGAPTIAALNSTDIEGFINPGFGELGVEPISGLPVDIWNFDGRLTAFGNGGVTAGQTVISGDQIGFFKAPTGTPDGIQLQLYSSYVSGSALFAQSLLSGSFASLGITPGVYVTDLQGGQTLTVTAVPVPAAVWLFGSALVGLGWLRRKQTHSFFTKS